MMLYAVHNTCTNSALAKECNLHGNSKLPMFIIASTDMRHSNNKNSMHCPVTNLKEPSWHT